MGAIRDRIMGNYRGVILIESTQAPDGGANDAIIVDKRLDSDPAKTAGQIATIASLKGTESPNSDTTSDFYNVALSGADAVWT